VGVEVRNVWCGGQEKIKIWCLGKESNDEQLGMHSFFVVDFL